MPQRSSSQNDYGTIHKSYLNPDGTLKVIATSLLDQLLFLNPGTRSVLTQPEAPPTPEHMKQKIPQEMVTQLEFLEHQSLLPFDVRVGSKEVLQRAGVKFFGRCSSNPQLQLCELPGGWKKVRTSGSDWTHLVDNKGVIRARNFYRKTQNTQQAFMEIHE